MTTEQKSPEGSYEAVRVDAESERDKSAEHQRSVFAVRAFKGNSF